MSIVAYAAGVANPIANPTVDKILDLSIANVPGLTAQLFGDVIDGDNPAGPFSWAWTILAEPDQPGNPGSLNTPVSQDPILEDIDVWGNYRLFLVVTNTVTSETSETNPLLAPDSAFVVVRLLSVDKGLQKQAAGERNWHDDHRVLVQAVEDIDAGPDNVIDHLDVAAATGPDLDVLVSQGLADDPNDPGTSLHTHRGVDVPLATPATQGTIILEEAGNARAITQERIILQGNADGTRVVGSGYLPGIIVPRLYDGAVGTAEWARWHVAWRIEEAISIQEYTVSLIDGGPMAPTTDTTFDLYTAASVDDLRNKNDVKLNREVTSDVTTRPTSDAGPMTLRRTADFPLALLAGSYLMLVCEAAPKISEGDFPGGGLSVQVHCRRAVP